VDVSTATLDACIGRDGVWQQFARSIEGIAQLALFCQAQQVSLVVMEATGGYERLPFAQLWAADVPVALVNPRSVRRFAEAMGALEKTDRIDTGMIAWYAETKRLVPTPPSSEKQQRFMALVLRMRQLTDLRTAQNNQRRLVEDPDALASFSAIVATINQQIRSLAANPQSGSQGYRTHRCRSTVACAGYGVPRDQGGRRPHGGPTARSSAGDRHPVGQGGRQTHRARPDRQR
jgi:transposase